MNDTNDTWVAGSIVTGTETAAVSLLVDTEFDGVLAPGLVIPPSVRVAGALFASAQVAGSLLCRVTVTTWADPAAVAVHPVNPFPSVTDSAGDDVGTR